MAAANAISTPPEYRGTKSRRNIVEMVISYAGANVKLMKKVRAGKGNFKPTFGLLAKDL
jgi:hypothetical protein